MAISKAQQKAVHNYVRNNYDRIELTVSPKGTKDQIKAHAAKKGETLNGFINRAINETIQRDNEAALSAPVQPEEVKPDSTVAFHSEQVCDLTPHQRAAPVDVLGLSVRTYNMIRRAGCETVGELAEYLHTDKCVIPHEGKAYREIEDALNEFEVCSRLT